MNVSIGTIVVYVAMIAGGFLLSHLDVFKLGGGKKRAVAPGPAPAAPSGGTVLRYDEAIDLANRIAGKPPEAPKGAVYESTHNIPMRVTVNPGG